MWNRLTTISGFVLLLLARDTVAGSYQPQRTESTLAAATTKSDSSCDRQAIRAEALLRNGKGHAGMAEARQIVAITSTPMILNNLAYAMADTGTGIAMAVRVAEKVVAETERSSARSKLTDVQSQMLDNVMELAAYWDTLGWSEFRAGDLAKAERYVGASWQLCQQAAVAEHLGTIYEQAGKRQKAAHFWRLALAANGNLTSAKEHLQRMGGSDFELVALGPNTVRLTTVTTAEELGRLRTIPVPSLAKQTGSAEYVLLISSNGIEDVRFIQGDDSLKNAVRDLKATEYDFVFPDAGPEKLIRRGVMSCSADTTPSCKLTLSLPTNQAESF